MAEASIELWLLLGIIAGAFVLATLGVMARRIAQDSAMRQLRRDVTSLRDEYARRTGEARIIEAEEERLNSMLASETTAEVVEEAA